MLTLGQASWLALAKKPIDKETKQKAKDHLKKYGLIAVHISGQDSLIPVAIGIKVHELNPYRYITYPKSPKMLPTKLPDIDGNDDINSGGKSSSDQVITVVSS